MTDEIMRQGIALALSVVLGAFICIIFVAVIPEIIKIIRGK